MHKQEAFVEHQASCIIDVFFVSQKHLYTGSGMNFVMYHHIQEWYIANHL